MNIDILGATGYKGGELVFRYGVGVMSQSSLDQAVSGPATPLQEKEDDHSHDHGNH